MKAGVRYGIYLLITMISGRSQPRARLGLYSWHGR